MKLKTLLFIISPIHITATMKVIKLIAVIMITIIKTVIISKYSMPLYLTTTPSKSFYIIFVDIFSEIISPLKNQ